ncbi:hypothetical protein ACFVG1_13200 [Streptomyces bacillaris]|uniref:hypothetical protein n=1 Tax=Streptomyces bacillaris TaxID=68179 RepID=UPI0035DF3F65
MTANTMPAATPGPNQPTPPPPAHAPTPTPATTTPGTGTGLLASLMTPVQPARTTFNLNPATAPQSASQGSAQTAAQAVSGGTAVPAGGVSSAAFHDDDTAANSKTTNPSNSTTGKAKQGMIRALVLAAAARWAKGGGTANKRLDAQKAAAQAQQVKETRQVTVNRSPSTGLGGGRGSNGGGSGSSPASGGSGKSLNRKSPNGGTSKNTSPAGPKNNPSPSKNSSTPNGRSSGPSGPSGQSGRGGTGGTGNRAGQPGGAAPRGGHGQNTGGHTTPAPKPTKTKDTPAPTKNTPPPTHGNTKTPTGGGGPAGKGGQKGTPGAAGTPGKNGKPPTGPSSTAPQANGKSSGENTSTKTPKQPSTKDKTTSDNTTDPKSATKPKPDLTKNPKNKKPTTKPDPDKTDTTPSADGSDERLVTQSSRETGYRDGTRAAQAAAHVRAYRDGVKDGWADTLAAADHEKTLLDQAHNDRRTSRNQPNPSPEPVPADESETPVTTAPPSSTDHHTTPASPEPIQVTSIDAKNLHLGDGATRTTISRGEVRSLKQYERLLAVRLTSLQAAADSTKNLQGHAETQAQAALNLLENTKTIKGGEKLSAALTRLHDNAKQQALEAAELHKRTVRAADHCQATLANVATRYGGLYQAVIDSPETVPAELTYYKGA